MENEQDCSVLMQRTNRNATKKNKRIFEGKYKPNKFIINKSEFTTKHI